MSDLLAAALTIRGSSEAAEMLATCLCGEHARTLGIPAGCPLPTSSSVQTCPGMIPRTLVCSRARGR